MKTKLLRKAIEAIQLLREIRDEQKSQKKDWSIIFAKDYLTEEEAAAYLGCTKTYIRTLMRGNGNGPIIPYYMPTTYNRYIARVDLDRFITQRRMRSTAEITAQAAKR